jgi:hypothetical protein
MFACLRGRELVPQISGVRLDEPLHCAVRELPTQDVDVNTVASHGADEQLSHDAVGGREPRTYVGGNRIDSFAAVLPDVRKSARVLVSTSGQTCRWPEGMWCKHGAVPSKAT